ncbi:mitochondrial protein [Ceratocystis fimbriata CBS 114723]|uniref:Mitochondrial protein n=2 Tax=Ceratocystis TaxID=5157 RepID=A0A2C5X2Y6_9PEZI|nr:mitochondrial protein [Ceratocystis fimbriata CBS 114723]
MAASIYPTRPYAFMRAVNTARREVPQCQTWCRTYSTPPPSNLVYPNSNTSAHKDMRTFLNYASRTGLDPKSTVFVGTYYEYLVRNTLACYGFDLRRIGGACDGGIDLLGVWTPPSAKAPLHVIVQCKGGGQAVGPRLIRELEGAFVGAPAGWRGDNVLGVFVSESSATKGMREAMVRSKWPMATITCTTEDGGALRQLLWNKAADAIGLDGLGVNVKRSVKEKKELLVLTWEGRPVRLKPAPEIV